MKIPTKACDIIGNCVNVPEWFWIVICAIGLILGLYMILTRVLGDGGD